MLNWPCQALGKCYTYQDAFYHRWHQCFKIVSEIGGKLGGWHPRGLQDHTYQGDEISVYPQVNLLGLWGRPMDGE